MTLDCIKEDNPALLRKLNKYFKDDVQFLNKTLQWYRFFGKVIMNGHILQDCLKKMKKIMKKLVKNCEMIHLTNSADADANIRSNYTIVPGI